ncbi:hypothetical protein G6F70_006054 [Rhizopus microsporus]|uniref:Homeobox domain-containing protein n=3 Tax=Rhizopus TaxID=4842 RepID=A0A367IU93_RHIAZ|nr:hypothetical protein G6F71_006594 [Rhizopus microsporus]RCH81260.1 hypothetical protein CU097_004110 [Rhizopus azygosporus]KAG1198131.1 hypothetical protein G6F70_006054 [Rhizopus microsporus]KAG1209850.1 hypothetical protein G6F69_005989 [Rhizopus microsporus]KAG1231480.1 hypothetical protein G6F67_005718 [Rhizopus microsporus]
MHSKPYPPTSSRRRTHLKPSQVAVLQETFVTNTLPDAAMRAQLAQELGVSERTVQIWFQNRRAKARKLEQSTLQPNVRTGWIDMPVKQKNSQEQHFQTTFRTLVTPECYEEPVKKRPRSSSKPERFCMPPPSLPPRAMSEGMDRSIAKEAKEYITIPVTALHIGTWARFATPINDHEYDLVCLADGHQLIWQVQDGGHQFRIHVNYNQIQQIRLGSLNPELGQLDIEIKEVTFSMKRCGTDLDWVRCGDFTEYKQASLENMIHSLNGNHNQLKHSLLELIAQAPQLASKLVLMPSTMYRDMSTSPSVTPEPAYFDQTQWLIDPKHVTDSLPLLTTTDYQDAFDHSNHWLLDPLLPSDQNILNFI